MPRFQMPFQIRSFTLRRALIGLFACLIAFGPLPALAQMAEAPPNVKLNAICEEPTRFGCPVDLSIEGLITADAARAFGSLLELEQKRAGTPLRPTVTIQSAGGDLAAAMFIGREIRKRLGVVVSNGPCHSACVFVAMGGVERNVAGIGLHRPYAISADAASFGEVDMRHKKMIQMVRDYLFEMNIADDVMRVMLAIPPGEMLHLPGPDARRVGLNGLDPAFEELRTAQEAREYGLSSAELRRRHASLDTYCGREDDMRSVAELRKRNECRTKIRDRVLWGLDEERYASLVKSSSESCKALKAESIERRSCVRSIAESLIRSAVKSH